MASAPTKPTERASAAVPPRPTAKARCPATQSKRRSAATLARLGAPPSSTSRPNFEGRTRSVGSATRACSRSVTTGRMSGASSSVELGRRPNPASGLARTLRTASAAASSSSRPSSPKPSQRDGSASSRTPRSCRLARAERSRRALPWRSARSAMASATVAGTMPPVIFRRTSRPSRADIGRSAPGHQPFLRSGRPLMPPPACRRAWRHPSCGGWSRSRAWRHRGSARRPRGRRRDWRRAGRRARPRCRRSPQRPCRSVGW